MIVNLITKDKSQVGAQVDSILFRLANCKNCKRVGTAKCVSCVELGGTEFHFRMVDELLEKILYLEKLEERDLPLKAAPYEENGQVYFKCRACTKANIAAGLPETFCTFCGQRAIIL